MSDEKKQSSKFVTDNNIVSDNPLPGILRTQRATNAASNDDFSASALKRLSEVRRGQIHTSKEGGSLNKSGDFSNSGIVAVRSDPKRKFQAEIKRAIETTPSLTKMADFAVGTTNTGLNRGVDRAIPEIYSPLFQVANLNLPRDRMTMNAWNRNFFDTHPVVRNAITLHATYPISKINVKCKHRKVEQFFNDMAEKIDLFDAIAGVAFEFWKMGESVKGNSFICLSDGSLKQIKDIQIGDEVITHLGNKKKVIERFIKPIKRLFDEKINVYKIKILGLPDPLIISGNHPMFTLAQSKIACQTPSCKKLNLRVWPGTQQCKNCDRKYINEEAAEFTATNSINENDLVCASFNSDIVDNEIFTPGLCYLIGFWLAEGSYLKRKNKDYTIYDGIRVSQNDKEFLQNYIEPLFIKHIGVGGQIYTNKTSSFFGELETKAGEKHSFHYQSKHRDGDKVAQFFLEHCGEYSTEKKLSETLMYLSPHLQLQLLAGFIDGDGCVDQSNGHIIISTSSQNLANQFLLLLRRCNIKPTMSKTVAKCNGEEKSFNYRIKIVANEAYDSFKDLLKTEKKNKLRKTKWSTQRTALQNNWQLLPIQSIEDITDTFTDEFMYDIEVEDDHSYIANGVAVHNCFPYAELDETNGIWSNIVIQNPDYVTVKKSGVSNMPIISLRPDEILKKIVSSNHPADVKLRSQIPDNIIHHIKKNEPIPLDNFNISHLKMLSSPYDVRGTSIIVSCYKDLMLYDKLRECFSQDTEILTDLGFKKWSELILQNSDGTISPNHDYKIATYNQQTDEIEYQYATDVVLRDYDGEMVEIKSKNIDLFVTPGHELFVYNEDNDWHKVEAKKLIGKRLKGYKVKNTATWVGQKIDHVNVLGKFIPAKLYLKFLGYLISEGWVIKDKRSAHSGTIGLAQSIDSDCYEDMRNVAIEFFKYFDRKPYEIIRQPEQLNFKKIPKVSWQCRVGHGELCEYFMALIGTVDGCTSHYKHIPRYILELEPKLLNILLNALIKGDGSEYIRKHCTTFKYFTASSQLANDVQEIVFKCGYYSSLRQYKQDDKTYYEICWSNSGFGKTPELYDSRTGKSHLTTKQYNGKVWCVTVPNGIITVRNNGRISIQSNCKFAQADSLINPITLISVGGTGEGEYHPTDAALEAYRQIFEEAQWDKDFKIITHAAVKVERVGATGAIVDTQNDFNFIRENLYAGLMVPKAIMDTEGTAYASASVGLEVLRTRYITFRNMIEKWLEKKIFAPISEIQGFFEYRNGKRVLIVPQIDWNHINLYDLNDYIQALGGYVEKNKISVHTLYRSLGLNWEEEQRLIREETVRNAILIKENEQLQKMSLMELRSLDPDEPIVENNNKGEAVPGETGVENMEGMPAELGTPDMSGVAGGAEFSTSGPPVAMTPENIESPGIVPGVPAEPPK